MESYDGSFLAERFRETRRQLMRLWLKLWGGGFVVILIGFALAWFCIKPAPPRTVVIATGSADGAYYEFARDYAEHLELHGMSLDIRTTAGSLENYRLLKSEPDVHLAIVQGGTIPPGFSQSVKMESVASLYLEPVWIFYRAEHLDDLRSLHGKKIGVGEIGSGTHSIAELLLKENGIGAASNTELISVGGTDAARQLKNGELDVAFFVTSPTSNLIRDLMSLDDVKLMSLDRHAAYSRRHPFLSDVTLKRGVVDLEKDLPAHDIHMVAPAANLVATSDFHDSLVPLLLRAAAITHEQGSTLVSPGRFPSTEFLEFPLNDTARRYHESGPPFLQKYLPFWIASGIDRGKILLVPAITLLLPLFKVGPPLYRWRIRSRIYRWYEILREIEGDLRSGADTAKLRKHLATLTEIEQELDDLDSVPLSYMEEFYNLRLHVEFVERRVQRDLKARVEHDST